MLFIRAVLTLFAYDVPEYLLSLRDHLFDGQTLEGCQHASWSKHHQPCLHGGQLRLHLVPETGALPAALLRHYVLAQETWRIRTHGPRSTETSIQGACMG